MIDFDINKLKKYAPLYIIGHKKPDVDTIVSSYLLSNILNYLGIEAYPCILDSDYDIDEYNGNIINDYLKFEPIIINKKDIDKHNFILVDHNDPVQSLGSDTNIIWCFDHHKDSGQITKLMIGTYCANSLFIYDYFKDIYQFNEQEKTLITIAIFTDTLFLKTDRYKDNDRKLLEEIGVSLDSDAFLKKYFIETDLSMGIANYISKSDRDFSYYKVKFTSSVIQLINASDEIVLEYKNEICKRCDNHLGLLRDLSKNKTYAFFKLGKKLKSFEYDKVVSRSTILFDVINELKKY